MSMLILVKTRDTSAPSAVASTTRRIPRYVQETCLRGLGKPCERKNGNEDNEDGGVGARE